MKAIVCTKYGSPDVLQLKEVEKPTPKPDEVLVKIFATTVTAAEGMMRKGTPFYGRLMLGILRPKSPIPGTGFAGIIESVGENVSQFKPGDAVFGETSVNFGANAEYLTISESGLLVPQPENLPFADTAPICDGALTAMNFLKNLAIIQPGQRVLINGASGSQGTYAVQLAKHFGAIVTGVCSTKNVALVQSLGAEHVIDYTKTDFTKNKQRYDIVYDTVGKLSFSGCKSALTENGVFISPVLAMSLLFQMLWTSKFSSKKAKFSATGLLPIPESKKLLTELVSLFASGTIKTVIDRRYPLEGVPDAHRYVETGHKTGNIVIDVVQE
ncbi:MAG: NAD(P)-dependent alcohol dehydrogenase [Calditrichae bacterium]|nr:NAD(P)-dependent alcohol dehydrogenase [Calditrichia bacterium]